MKDSKERFVKSMLPALGFILIIWTVHLIQYCFNLDLGYLGVFPRRLETLKGILFTPLIHGSFSHLINNTIPFAVLSTIIFYFYPKVAWRSLIMIYFLSGIGVWFFGRTTYHIGASGVVYGLMAFIIATGIFRRNIKSIALALIVFLYYSGMLVGLFPIEEGVSFEGHISGFVVGIFAALYYKFEIEFDEMQNIEPPIPDHERPYFFPRDIFDKTIQQRQEELEERLRQEAEAKRLAELERLEQLRLLEEGTSNENTDYQNHQSDDTPPLSPA